MIVMQCLILINYVNYVFEYVLINYVNYVIEYVLINYMNYVINYYYYYYNYCCATQPSFLGFIRCHLTL